MYTGQFSFFTSCSSFSGSYSAASRLSKQSDWISLSAKYQQNRTIHSPAIVYKGIAGQSRNKLGYTLARPRLLDQDRDHESAQKRKQRSRQNQSPTTYQRTLSTDQSRRGSLRLNESSDEELRYLNDDRLRHAHARIDENSDEEIRMQSDRVEIASCGHERPLEKNVGENRKTVNGIK